LSGADGGLRDAARHLRAVLPHGRSLPESQWQARHRALLWLLRAHVPAIFLISLLYDQGWQAFLDGATVGFFAVLAQFKLGGRRAQSLVVTVGLLSCSALLVHITSGLTQSYFHFFVMVAALSLYEDWFPFAIAVLYVLVQQAITAEIVDYEPANSPGSGGSCTPRSSVRFRSSALPRGARPSATAWPSARWSSHSRRAW
jgi:hypothetical protein